jgi:RNA polymerase sigma-70 factor (ECF subfamily)
VPDDSTDELLLERAGAGDSTAFIELYERYRTSIFRFAFRLCGSAEQAEDIAHDCFLSLIRKPAAYKPGRASLKTYLLAAARNLWLKTLRSSGRESSLDDVEEQRFVSTDSEPLGRLLNEELAVTVQRAVLGLSPLQREALVLFEYEGLALNEIAELIGTDVGAVKSRLHRARQSLKSVLRPYFDSNAELNPDREIVTLEQA